MNANTLWNWQQRDWPNFGYQTQQLEELEARFLYQSGILLGAYKHINKENKTLLTIELMLNEALNTSEIEGEYLNRDSVKSSIRRQFGLDVNNHIIPPAEQGIAEMMVDLYQNFNEPLSHDTLFKWHQMITSGRHDLQDTGCYRTHAEPMLVVSGVVGKPKIHFEAPPSKSIPTEMQRFITWFNQTAPGKRKSLPALTRASIAHLYFVCIHPFEDGNGRVGRAIADKALFQCLRKPILLALSQTVQNNKKAYYDSLENNNKNNEITNWLIYFSKTILEAQAYTLDTIEFLINKTKFYDRYKNQLNERQAKVIARIFREGVMGFRGGLSAQNYIRIAKTSASTATRDLQDLVSKGILQRTGERKSTRYWLHIQ